MEDQAELLVLDQRKEPKRAVACPFDHQRFTTAGDDRFDISRPLTQHRHGVARSDQGAPIAIPRSRDSFGGVVEQIEITRDTVSPQRHRQRDAASDVTLAMRAARRG
jgi:hypothetical protein